MNSGRAQSRHRDAPVLPDELVAEILSYLPVKALMRLKCVCQSWKSLILNPNFAKLHLQKSARNPHLILIWDPHSVDLADFDDDSTVVPFPVRCLVENSSLPTIPDDRCYRLHEKDCDWVVGSCNGLLCLLAYSITHKFEHYWLCLWNPATRLNSEKLGHFRVPKSPEPCLFKFAFGYDNLTGTYKVVAFRTDDLNWQNSEVRVYGFGDRNGWRNLESFSAAPIYGLHSGLNDGVYLNGSLNWLARCDSRSVYNENAITIDQLVILSLDLGNEKQTHLSLPRGFDEVPRDEPNIGVLMGCLCFTHDYKTTEFVVWQMREFGVQESWTQFVRVSYQVLQIEGLQYHFRLWLLCGSENGDMLIMAKEGERRPILYNRRDNTVERIRTTYYICWPLAKDYVESLVLPF